MKNCYKSLGVLTIIYIAVFSIFPQLDIEVSKLFYNEEGNNFPMSEHPASLFIYYTVRYLAIALFLVAFGCYMYDVISPRIKFIKIFAPFRDFIILSKKQSLFLSAVIFTIPYFILHFVLKPLWGRPRPFQINDFSGILEFSPIYQLHPSWDLNSFPSGHTSMAFSLIAVYFVLPEAPREKMRDMLWLCAVLGGINRVVMGGHFLSDVIASAIITLFGILLLKKLILD